MRDATAGDPITGLKWTHKSLRAVARELTRTGYPISAPTVGRLLAARHYALRVNRKKLAGFCPASFAVFAMSTIFS